MATALIILGALLGIYLFLRICWWLVRHGASDSGWWGGGGIGSI